MNYNTTTLANGLRVIHRPSASAVVYCGYQVAAGTRHELPGEEGLAHFCEHMTFKGTRRRSAVQIINALEQVGGELNAFTNKEDTTFYAAVGRDHVSRAVDLLTDIVFCSDYPQTEVEKEAEVVCDEIESYNDSPAELIYDEFENLLFQGHPLGHNILGTASQVRAYRSDDVSRFARRHYRPGNCVFFIDGDISFQRVVRLLETSLAKTASPTGDACPTRTASPAGETAPFTVTRHHGTHQAHVMLGTRAYAYNDPRRMALYLLNNILGGPGMNARLNLSLRERNGLVYTVESSMTCYGDTGLWAVYFGCDPHDVSRCLRLVRHQLERLRQRPLSATQLRTAQQQLKGQLAIACDNREQFALDFGRSFLHQGAERHLDRLFASIDALTASELQRVAVELFDEQRLSTLIFR